MPVLGGLAVIVVIALSTWGIAAYISSGGAQTNERLAPSTFRVSTVETAANLVADQGPILLPGLNTTSGDRSMVLDHEGDDPATGWRVYFAYPAGSDQSCPVSQVVGTRQFVDCDGITLDVTELSPPPPGINPIVENGVLSIDLRGVPVAGG